MKRSRKKSSPERWCKRLVLMSSVRLVGAQAGWSSGTSSVSSRPTGSAFRPATRLFEGGCGVNRVGGLWLSLRSCPGSGLLRSLSALGGARGRVAAVPASQIVCGPSGGQTNGGACRDRIGRAGGAGLERLLQREDVPGGDEDLASDGGLGGGGLAVALLGAGVERVPRVVRAPRLLGGFDGGPAQRVGPGLGQPAGARALSGLLNRGGQAGVADQLARRREAGDVADLRGEGEPEQLGDAGDRHQQLGALIGAGVRPQLALERREPTVEVVDDAQQRGD